MKTPPIFITALPLLFVLLSTPSSFAGKLMSREVFVDPRASLAADGGLSDGEFALTFDDGPAPHITRKILAILRAHEVKAVFFEVGLNAEAHPELTQQILKEGHSLGSHSWDHADLATLPLADAVENIERGHAAVLSAAGGRFSTPFFRFPGFSWTAQLLDAVQKLGLLPFQANIVTEDWMTPDPRELLKKALAMVDREKHGILLFHDIQPQTAEMLDAFLTELENRGSKSVVFRARP